MKWKKYIKFLFFLIYTYCISQSVILAIGIILLLGRGALADFWEYFLMTVCQGHILYILFTMPWTDRIALAPVIALIYMVLVWSLPFCLFWRKRTVFRAWLVAMSCIFIPGDFVTLFGGALENHALIWAVPLMSLGYLLAGLIMHWVKKYRKRPAK